MDWGFIFLMFVLKVPLFALIALVWWAIKQTPDDAEDHSGGGDGGSRVDHPRDPRPRHPRRGPHADPALPAPPRVRAVTTRTRTPER
jgi:hypothetical protein